MAGLVLVLDQGGHSSRGLVFDRGGAVVAQAAVPVPTRYPAADRVEQDPSVLVESLRAVCAELAGQLGARVQALAYAGLIVQRSSLLGWDRRSGQPLCPVLSWQDTRHAAWLEAHLRGREDWLRQLTGLFPNAHYGASKMRWLLDHDPAIRRAAADGSLCLGPLAAFLQQQLTGTAAASVDAVIASRTLLTGIAAQAWSPVLLDCFAIPAAVLPGVQPTRADYGWLKLGEHPVPLRLLGGDQSFFALSHPAWLDDHTVFINAGTGAFIQQRMAANRVPPRLLCAPLLLGPAEVIVAEGTVNAAATALDWWQQQAGVSLQDFAWDAADAEASGGGLPVFLNRVTATGSPDWLAAGPSAFNRPAPVSLQALAVLESVVFGLQRNLECLAAVQASQRIVVSGGLARTDLFCQRLADLSGLPVWRSDDVEACARGAALQLLPGMASVALYQCFSPQVLPGLAERYREWSAWRDQSARSG